jgi:hypothetical protein
MAVQVQTGKRCDHVARGSEPMVRKCFISFFFHQDLHAQRPLNTGAPGPWCVDAWGWGSFVQPNEARTYSALALATLPMCTRYRGILCICSLAISLLGIGAGSWCERGSGGVASRGMPVDRKACANESTTTHHSDSSCRDGNIAAGPIAHDRIAREGPGLAKWS